MRGPADVAELVDAHGSGPCGGDPVEVQVLSSASPTNRRWARESLRCGSGRRLAPQDTPKAGSQAPPLAAAPQRGVAARKRRLLPSHEGELRRRARKPRDLAPFARARTAHLHRSTLAVRSCGCQLLEGGLVADRIEVGVLLRQVATALPHVDRLPEVLDSVGGGNEGSANDPTETTTRSGPVGSV